MVEHAEFLIPPETERLGAPMLRSLMRAAEQDGCAVRFGQVYRGRDELLVLYGIGAKRCREARAVHVASGRPVLIWDLGYFGPIKGSGYRRFSLDRDHPQHLLERAPLDASRWEAQGIALREDFDPAGPIILVGLGKKTQRYLGLGVGWELRKFEELRHRFPDKQIIFRPKGNAPTPALDCPRDATTPIAELLKGASLVACRHSNVAVDAAIAGVPFECDDGAARWLSEREFSRENRIEFLRRLAWFQWVLTDEAGAAWSFLKQVMS
jgi:hypothetical protein